MRGSILQALRALPAGGALTHAQAEGLCADAVQLDRCIASLDDDGLIEILPGHAMRLPA